MKKILFNTVVIGLKCMITKILPLALVLTSSGPALADLALIGPNGMSAIVYPIPRRALGGGLVSTEEFYVVFCAKNTVLGITVDSALKNCRTKPNEVIEAALPYTLFSEGYELGRASHRVSALRNTLRNINHADLSELRIESPTFGTEMSESEIVKILALEDELKQIESYISAYGDNNADLVRKNQIEDALTLIYFAVKLSEAFSNAEINTRDLTTLHILKYSDPHEQAVIEGVFNMFKIWTGNDVKSRYVKP